MELFWGLILNGVLAAGALYIGAATPGAALCGGIMGLCVYTGFGARGLALLAAFVVVAFAATIYSCRRRPRPIEAPLYPARRGASQATANLFVAATCATLVELSGAMFFTVGYTCALAAALADTLSGELGPLFGPKPRLITTLRPASPGTDGAISWQGLVHGAAGATLIALLAMPLLRLPWRFVWLVILAGMIGDVADSVIGALLSSKSSIGNDITNLVATGIAAVVGAGIYLLV